MATGLIQEGVDLPGINPKYKYGLLRTQSDALLKRSQSFNDQSVARSRLQSESSSLKFALRSSSQPEEDNPPATANDAPKGSPLFQGHRSKSMSAIDLVGLLEEDEVLDLLSESKLFGPLSLDKSQHDNKLSKRESLKVQKKHYRREKKRAAKELLSTLKDPSVIVMADWLKIRGTLKGWTKLWCVLKPGMLVMYKSHKQKSSQWVGTVLLNTCELLERPSKKDGFCFKLFHPLDQSVWATKGPKGESIGAITQPLPYSYLIFRAFSEAAGKCWMDALELALRCSSLLMRTMTKDTKEIVQEADTSINTDNDDTFLSPLRQEMNESDCERHFMGHGLEDDNRTDKEDKDKSESESEHSEEEEKVFDDDLQPIETPYIVDKAEELGQQGDACQTEEVADENKGLIWGLVKQVRPGMDLSKVVLPTFILEPRSFLDKISDYYYHSDFLSQAVLEEDAYTRMKSVVRWYLAGYYKKPKGLKKPYNPILGETFRCYWKHPNTGSRTFYIAEQISHHPPVSAFYITNRQDGFSISGSILAKSKFYGNSLSAIMDGYGRLSFLKRGEDYTITMPYAHCKGILIGTLTMEYGGKVSIECEKTGYRADLEFKLKPFLGSGEASNRIVGKIKLGNQTLSTIEGHWDQEIYIKDKTTAESELFWNPTPEMKMKRLKRYTVPMESQGAFESERLWSHVTVALNKADQNAATHEKYLLEEAQRKEARERKAKMEDWNPNLFERDEITGDWVYKYADLRPWDPLNDVLQYEQLYVIQTKTRHRTPIVRTTSILNVEETTPRGPGSHKRQASIARIKRTSIKQLRTNISSRESGSSTPDAETRRCRIDSESSESTVEGLGKGESNRPLRAIDLEKALQPLLQLHQDANQKLSTIQSQLLSMQRRTMQASEGGGHMLSHRDLYLIGTILVLQLVLVWLFK